MDLHDVRRRAGGVRGGHQEHYRRPLSYHPDRLHNRRSTTRRGARPTAVAADLGGVRRARRRAAADGVRRARAGAVRRAWLLSPRVDTADSCAARTRGAAARGGREHEARCRLQGSLVLSCSVADVVQPGDPSTPLWRAPPARTSVAMSEEMSLQLDKRNTLVVATSCSPTASRLDARLGFRRQLAHRPSRRSPPSTARPKRFAHVQRRIRATPPPRRAPPSSPPASAARGPLPKVGLLSLKVSCQLTRCTTGELQLSRRRSGHLARPAPRTRAASAAAAAAAAAG